MQLHFQNNNVNVDIPVVRIMNTAHFLAAYMFSTECSGDQLEYDAIAHDSLSRDKQLTRVAMIVLAAMLKRTQGFRASNCRNLILENREPDFDYGVTLYDRFLRSAEKRFSEENFLIDTHAQILSLKAENTRLTSENIQLKYTITTMEKAKPQTIVYNYGTVNDIHDNHNCNIYTTDPENSLSAAPHDSAESILGIPTERDYRAVRIYIEERSRFDAEFKTFCDANSRVALCERLSKEFGWIVDPYGLGRNINRTRKKKA